MAEAAAPNTEMTKRKLIDQHDNCVLARGKDSQTHTELEMSDIDRQDQKLILIVEDNELSAKLFVDILHAVRPHFRVECFECPEAGFEFAKQHHPDLIHLDCQLPYFSGFDFITWCRATPSLANVPTVMITAQAKFDLQLPAPDHPSDPRYFGLPRAAVIQSNSQLCRLDRNGIASCPRPDRVYYKYMPLSQYVEVIDDMIAPSEDSLRHLPVAPAPELPDAHCTPARAHQFRWRRGRFLSVDELDVFCEP
jgi:CheY-like chemotaxis protein